jgi:hypothetical protein
MFEGATPASHADKAMLHLAGHPHFAENLRNGKSAEDDLEFSLPEPAGISQPEPLSTVPASPLDIGCRDYMPVTIERNICKLNCSGWTTRPCLFRDDSLDYY